MMFDDFSTVINENIYNGDFFEAINNSSEVGVAFINMPDNEGGQDDLHIYLILIKG